MIFYRILLSFILFILLFIDPALAYIDAQQANASKAPFKPVINQYGVFKTNPKALPSEGYIIKFRDDPVVNHIKKWQIGRGHLNSGALQSERLIYRQGLLVKHENFVNTLNPLLGRLKNSRHPGFKIKRHFTNSFNGITVRFSGLTSADEKAIVETIKQDLNVQAVTPNYAVRALLYQSAPLIGANQVWSYNSQKQPCNGSSCITGQGVTIGIIDSGIDYKHPELGNGCFGAGCKVAGGYNFINDTTDSMDDFGHGTHVASIAAGNGAQNGGSGLNGVAPGATLYAIKVLDSTGHGTFDNIIAGIDWALDPNQDGNFSDHLNIINLSLGAYCGTYSKACGPEDPLSMAINNAVSQGVVAVIAAGNDGLNGTETIGSPGVARDAITVAAADKQDNIAYFSSIGPVNYTDSNGRQEYEMKPDVTAPGVNICAAQWGTFSSTSPCVNSSGQTIYPGHILLSGTSMATPHVAGEAALLLQANPNWTPAEIKAALMNNISPVNLSTLPSFNQGLPPLTIEGHGRSNALGAFQAAVPNVVALDPLGIYSTDQTVNITGTAQGANFSGYTVSYQAGQNPSPQGWITICSNTQAVNKATLCSWNINNLSAGFYTLRLSSGTSIDYGMIQVQNCVISSPTSTLNSGSSIFSIWKTIPVIGTAAGYGFQNYTISLCEQGNASVCFPQAVSLTNGGQSPIDNSTLATINPTLVSQTGFYQLTLTDQLSSTTLTMQNLIYIDKQIHQGWPQKLFSIFYVGSFSLQFYGQPVAADLLSNGKKELIMAYGQTISVVGPEGQSLPGWPVTITTQNSVFGGPALMQMGPAAADLLGNGQQEVVVPDNGGYLHVLKNDGTYLFPPVQVFTSGYYVMAPSLVDVNNDGKEEIIMADAIGNIALINNQGQILWSKNLPPAVGFDPLYYPYSITVGDMANNGNKEIFIANTSYPTNKFSTQYWLLDAKTGNVLPGWPQSVLQDFINGDNNLVVQKGVMASLDGSSQLDIVSWSRNGKVFVWKMDGTNVAGWPQTANVIFTADPIVADIDNNGSKQIIIPSVDQANCTAGCFYVYNADGSTYPGSPIMTEQSSVLLWVRPIMGNLDDSLEDEILPQSGVSGSMNNGLGQIPAFKKNGSMVGGFPKLISGSTSLYSGSIGNYVISDLDNSGSNNMVAASEDGNVYVWDLAGSKSGGDSWPQYQHDAQNSGVFQPAAAILSPMPNSTLSSGTGVSFQWNSGRGVSQYQLVIGSSVGAEDIYYGQPTHNLTDTVNMPLNGRPLYAELLSKINGQWLMNSYVYQTISLLIPLAPTNVTATAGNAQAWVSFFGANVNGSPITSYAVISSPGNIIATGTSSPITVTGLTNGIAYTFTVTATNAIGTSAPSAPSNSVIPAGFPSPTDLAADFNMNKGIVELTWNAPNGGSVSSYQVYRNGNLFASTGLGYKDKTRDIETCTAPFTYYVKGIINLRAGTFTAPSNTVEVNCPNIPTNLVATIISASKGFVTLAWQAPTGVTVSSYQIYRNGVLLGSTTNAATTTYTDKLTEDCSGPFTYYVQGVINPRAKTYTAPSNSVENACVNQKF